MKRLTLFFLLSLCFFTLEIQAQAIIQDPDGYTNVRERGSISAPVSYRMMENEVFALLDWGGGPKPKWLPVSLSSGLNPDNCYGYLNKDGYMHESRILMLEDIEKQYSPQIEGSMATITGEQLKVVMTIEPKAENPPPGTCLLGSDQGYGGPNDRLASLEVTINGKPMNIPAEALTPLYYVSLKKLKVYQHQGSTFIYSSTNSAAGYYFCVWHIKNGVYQKRYLYPMH